MLIRASRPPRPAAALGGRSVAADRVRSRSLPVVEKTWICTACATESPIASKGCSTCKAGLEVEYYVAAALPFEGFDRFVPLLTRVLGVSEYQATQPLARVHTPIPYQHLESFHAKGPGANAPFRLAARGISSLVTARALAADLKEKGIESVVVGSDELKQPISPRKAQGMRFDGEKATFTFEQGPDREEREVRWSRISLVVFSAAMPMRGTMTIARDMTQSQGVAVDPSAYLLDVYEQGSSEGIRIAEHSFHRWEFLKPGGSERPADRFGKLLEVIEEHARDADIHYVTGIYRGPKTEWRMNFFSRFLFLIGEKVGWARQEGPPRLEGYEILEKVGEGGMGSVYRARQKKLGRIVAVKVIAAHLAAQKRFASRFHAEARAVAALSHPNIVQIIDLTENAGRHFMVMEFVEGQTLLKTIKDRGRVPEVDALRISLQVASALDHAWRRGIVHRDVKPDNIFVDAKGEAKLGDWGLAKEMDSDLGLTETGTALGTPYYMSPEQARGIRDLDVRSDLYSLGATLYHAVTGQPPFRGGSPAEVISKHLGTPAPDPRKIAPDVSPETAALLLRLLAKKPDDRVADATEAVRMLALALEAASRELAYT
jgi:tRNA A-37 threonylcarbamoyl transferase component Bud32